MAQSVITSQVPREQWVWALVIVAMWGLLPVSPTLCMLLICGSMFLLIKLHCIFLFGSKHPLPDLIESVRWCCWVGLKPESFFLKPKTLKPVKKAEYVLASLKVLTGIGFAVAATSMTSSPVLAAWMLWVGLGFILYFGLFHIHALFLQSQGRSVVPIMKAPLLSCSVSEFWGKRWNLAFRDYAHRTLFKPMSKRLGPQLATMIGFFFSGVIHEIAISIPAGGGYGFPMLYFLLQGVALIAERKFKSLKAGWRGRLWTIACVLIPAPLLFHSEFMTSVVFPIIKFLASIMGQ